MADDAVGIKTILAPQEFIFSENSPDFLPTSNDKDASVVMKPILLGNENNIRGVSFFAALKALDMKDAPWYVDHLRLPGTLNKADVKPDTQKVVLAILHGLHAYFASTDDNAPPSLRTPLPTRFRYVIGKFTALTDQKIISDIESVFTIMKRQYLNQIEGDDKLQIHGLFDALKTPVEFVNNKYFTQDTGKKAIPLQMDLGDTETVRDIYVARIPLATVVLGRRRR